MYTEKQGGNRLVLPDIMFGLLVHSFCQSAFSVIRLPIQIRLPLELVE